MNKQTETKDTMANFITYEEFLNSGLPVSDDISQYEVEFSINSTEEFYLKPALTDENYLALLEDPTNVMVTGGTEDGKHYAGIKQAMYHLVFAWMIVNDYRVTRYSTVEKNSEYSKSTDSEKLELLAKRHWEMGEAFIREVQDHYNLDHHNDRSNLFSTLLW